MGTKISETSIHLPVNIHTCIYVYIIHLHILTYAFITITKLRIVLFYIDKNDKCLKQKRKTSKKQSIPYSIYLTSSVSNKFYLPDTSF